MHPIHEIVFEEPVFYPTRLIIAVSNETNQTWRLAQVVSPSSHPNGYLVAMGMIRTFEEIPRETVEAIIDNVAVAMGMVPYIQGNSY